MANSLAFKTKSNFTNVLPFKAKSDLCNCVGHARKNSVMQQTEERAGVLGNGPMGSQSNNNYVVWAWHWHVLGLLMEAASLNNN